ncbi:MAG: hydroxymethylbilane synthase [Candidatus Pelagibacter sp.]|nr:hydroxymethylbilane synthase [Candidatus Pelagibacter sp.]
MKKNKIIIGSRGSKLALIYAENVKSELEKIFSNEIEIKKIATSGDENQKDRLSNLGGKGLFSTKIENELIYKKIDFAVHALKDMPSIETEGLITNFFLKRNSPNEILISRDNIKFKDLKKNSIIGTSSYRREFQLKQLRSDLKYKLIRGNVDTRIQKLENGEYDAILLSKAGIDILGLNNKISEVFDIDELIPCAGQGIIAAQCRDEDVEMKNLLEKINNKDSRILANTEREVLKILEGDCDTAVGVYAQLVKDKISLTAELFSVDGNEKYFINETDEINSFLSLGKRVGQKLITQSKGSYKR